MKTYQLLLSARAAWDRKTTARIARSAGFDGLEVVMGGLLSELPLEHYESSSVLPIVAVHAPYGIYTVPIFQKALNDAIVVAKVVGARVVNIHPPSHLPENGGQQNVTDCIHIFQELTAQHPTLRLCYEVLGHSTKGKETYPPGEWLQEVQKYHLPATVDTAHVASWGEDPGQFIGLVGTHLQHVHVSDYEPTTDVDHLWLGDGVINWSEFFAAVRSNVSEHLTITLEPSGSRTRPEESVQLITDNAAFIRQHLDSH